MSSTPTVEESPATPPPTGDGKVIFTTPYGKIEIVLHSNTARQHCVAFMDWVSSMLNEDDTPCCFQRLVKDFYLQFHLDETFKLTHPPIVCLQGMKFDRPGLCAFSNHNSDQFVITLDPCDALNHKYSIFGEISSDSMETLRSINQAEADEDGIPDELQLISIIEIKELMVGYPPSPPTETSTPSPVSSTPSTPDLREIKRSNTSSPLATSSSGINLSQTLVTSSSMLGAPRLASAVFQEPFGTPKRSKVEGSPKATPMTRSSTLILDQQQVFKASHYSSVINGMGDFTRPNIARSYSAPDMRVKFPPKWPKRLVIIRHGQSEQNACLDLYQDDIETLLAQARIRDCDIKLTEFGKWQAEQTGKYLANTDQFDICFCSPYQRAVNTAEGIAKELPYKLKIYKDNWLREKEFGRLHGLNEKAVREKFPLEYEIRNRDGKYWYRFPGGENYCDVEMRIHCFLEKLARDYAGRSVLVVTHQVPYKLFRALFQHLDEDGVLKLEVVHNCGIQEYLLDRTKSLGGRMKLKTFNFMAYKLTDCPPHLAAFTKSTD